MHNILRQIALLSWKNLKIIKRHWIKEIFEVLIPLLLFGFVAFIHSLIPAVIVSKPQPTFHEVITLVSTEHSLSNKNIILYYTPRNEFTSALMEKVAVKLGSNEPHSLLHFSNESDLEHKAKSIHEKSPYTIGKGLFGVIFLNLEEAKETNHLQYKIRTFSEEWDTTRLDPIKRTLEPMDSSRLYFSTGFLFVQMAIDSIYTDFLTKTKTRPFHSYTIQKFPHPPYKFLMTSFDVSMFEAALTVFSFFLLCLNITGRIVEEKSTGVKELMKLMGIPRVTLWFSWLLRVLVENVLMVTIIVILLTYPFNQKTDAVLANCNAFLVWVFFLLYSVSLVLYVFSLSTLFSRPVLAMIFVIVVYTMGYFIPSNIIAAYPSTSLSIKLILCLQPNMAMEFGWTIMNKFVVSKVDLGWHNLAELPSNGNSNDVKMSLVLLMLIADIFVYGLLTLYLDSILPGKFGVPQPFYFLCTKSFWTSKQEESSKSSSAVEDVYDVNSIESPPQGFKVGIKIQNLRKKYRSGKVAVDGVSMDIYESQITALLGHNGAGKTTLMSIITGMMPSSGGNVYVNNYNTRTDLAKVRKSLGLCPQHDMFFTDLTVMEHLVFFGMLKGSTKRAAKEEATGLLNAMQLIHKANVRSSALSGGMKRKLSLAISLIGESKVVILDEPTSGLDPQSRRQIWDLLLSMRGQRTILITTHYMEEADILGDRIAIMDHGRLQCYGTPMYLKKQYGAGYVLKLLIKNSCDVAHLTKTLQRKVSTVKLKSRLGSELSYTLPLESKSLFPELFSVIENDKASLGIHSIGLALTTLEDVFLRVGSQVEDREKVISKKTAPAVNKKESPMNKSQLIGIRLLYQQTFGLFLKRMIYTKRTWTMFLGLALLAILLSLGAVTFGLSLMLGTTVQGSLKLSLGNYESTVVVYSNVQSPVVKWYHDSIESVGSLPRAIPVAQSIGTVLIEEGKKGIFIFRENFIVAAVFGGGASNLSINAMYNDFGLHTAAISVNLINNALLQSHMNSNKFSITAINHPFEVKTNELKEFAKQFVGKFFIQMVWFLLISFGLLLFLGYFLIFPSSERISYSKQLQYVTGVSPIAFWLTCFLWDLIVYTIVATAIVVLLPIFDRHGVYGGDKEYFVFALILFLYGLCGIPYAYWFSFCSKSTPSLFGTFVGVNFVIGVIVPFVLSIVKGVIMVFDTNMTVIVDVIKGFLYILPQFNLAMCLWDFSFLAVSNRECKSMTAEVKHTICSSVGSQEVPSLFVCCRPEGLSSYLVMANKTNPNGLGLQLLMLFLCSFMYLAIVIFLDYRVVSRMCSKVKPSANQSDTSSFDEDVKAEIVRVRNCDTDWYSSPINPRDTNVLTVTDLSKKYGSRVVAVRGVTFGVLPSECFGLLGVNGAGKTTTFKMLTGDEVPSRGDARIGGFTLSRHRAKYMSHIGYCPQFDGFNEKLTGRENLTVFARLRGIPEANVKPEVAKWLKTLGLEEFKDAASGSYSGGNKRKLSTAIALIGDPPILFLDEPTSGVDPVARRNLWKVLSEIQKTNRSIVLTSHSMDECEALCNRLAIMVSGEFVCLGGAQRLKQKFGQGYTVQVRVMYAEATQAEQVAAVRARFEEVFEGCIFKGETYGLLEYRITDTKISWGTLFARMEAMKAESADIDDYTITETTLEEIFLSFARKDMRDTDYNIL